MVFERIKKVGGHEYKYLVENVRINGKVKQKTIKYFGRIDKKTESNALTIPYGFYYFAQENCGACSNEEEVIDFFNDVKRILNIDIQDIQYINITKEKIPIDLEITFTPTIFECSETGLFVGSDILTPSGIPWLSWKAGEDKMKEFFKKWDEEQEIKEIENRLQLKEEIKQLIREGKKYRELYKIYSDRPLIKESQQEIEDEKTKCKNGVCNI